MCYVRYHWKGFILLYFLMDLLYFEIGVHCFLHSNSSYKKWNGRMSFSSGGGDGGGGQFIWMSKYCVSFSQFLNTEYFMINIMTKECHIIFLWKQKQNFQQCTPHLTYDFSIGIWCGCGHLVVMKRHCTPEMCKGLILKQSYMGAIYRIKITPTSI